MFQADEASGMIFARPTAFVDAVAAIQNGAEGELLIGRSRCPLALPFTQGKSDGAPGSADALIAWRQQERHESGQCPLLYPWAEIQNRW
jgi:hypothetical protein